MLWLKLLTFLILHPFSDRNGSKLTNVLNENSSHSPKTSTQLYNWISVQTTCRTQSSSIVTLAQTFVSSSLQSTNCSFRYTSPYLWNQLPPLFHQPHPVHSPPGSSPPACITSSQSSPLLSLPRPFIPDLKLICSTNPFLYSVLRFTCTAFTDFRVRLDLQGTGICLFCFVYYISVTGYVC